MLVLILVSGTQLSRLRCDLPSVALLLSALLIQRSSAGRSPELTRDTKPFQLYNSKRNCGEKMAFVKIRKMSSLEDMHCCISC